MRSELVITNPSIELKDLQETIFGGINSRVDRIVLPAGMVGLAKSIYPDYPYAMMIGYPYGISGIEIKIHELTLTFKHGVKVFDVVINQNDIRNLEYKKIAREILALDAWAKNYQVEIRFVIEHRLESLSKNTKIAELLSRVGAEKLILSTGSMGEYNTDAIIHAYKIRDLTGIDTIPYSQSWSEKELGVLRSIGTQTYRTGSL